jgi:hypothetical protein
MSKKLRAIDPVAVKRLANTYQIDEGNLAINLTSVGNAYIACKHFTNKKLTLKEVKQKLETLRKKTGDLRERIDDANHFTTGLIQYKYKDLDKLNAALTEFEKSIPVITSKNWKFNSEVVSRDGLINDIAVLWQQYTGQAPTYSTARGKRGGTFIGFLNDVAQILGIDPDPLPERFSRLKRKNPDFPV